LIIRSAKLSFKKLYNTVDASDKLAISVNDEILPLCSRYTGENNINFIKTPINEDIVLGYMIKSGELGPPYVGDTLCCDIFYSNDLNDCWRRLVCAKELMHLFDPATARADNKTRFIKQLSDLTAPPQDTPSDQVNAENRAYWMAIAALCPLSLVDIFRDKWESKNMSDYDIALKFRIPEAYVPLVMSENYGPNVKLILTGDW